MNADGHSLPQTCATSRGCVRRRRGLRADLRLSACICCFIFFGDEPQSLAFPLRSPHYVLTMNDALDTLVFQAEVVPHRSLSPRGLSLVIGGMCAVSLAVTVLFWWLGAWPVAGFNGGEMLIAVVLLRANVRARRAREVLLLSERGLRILRFDQDGKRTESVLPSDWLNVTLTERPGRVPCLFLSARGQTEEVAKALGEDEKRDLAEAIRGALYRWRNPIFDNPQLR